MSNDQLKTLKSKRGSIKAQITNLEKSVNKIISEGSLTEDLITTLKEKLQRLLDKKPEFQTIQSEI